jgi:hypothetical protein
MLSMDGIVMWQNAMQALTKAAVFLVCFPFISWCAFIASLQTARTRRSLTPSRFGKAARQSTNTFSCCSRSCPKSIFSRKLQISVEMYRDSPFCMCVCVLRRDSTQHQQQNKKRKEGLSERMRSAAHGFVCKETTTRPTIGTTRHS